MIINFKERFVPAIEAGTKLQTIRRIRADDKTPRVGEILHLYTGLRSKKARKLKEVVCLSVKFVHMALRDSEIGCRIDVEIGGLPLTPTGIYELMKADGFDDADQMIDFFDLKDGPFNGYLYSWAPPAPHISTVLNPKEPWPFPEPRR